MTGFVQKAPGYLQSTRDKKAMSLGSSALHTGGMMSPGLKCFHLWEPEDMDESLH